MASSEFEAAVASVKELTQDPGNDVGARPWADTAEGAAVG